MRFRTSVIHLIVSKSDSSRESDDTHWAVAGTEQVTVEGSGTQRLWMLSLQRLGKVSAADCKEICILTTMEILAACLEATSTEASQKAFSSDFHFSHYLKRDANSVKCHMAQMSQTPSSELRTS